MKKKLPTIALSFLLTAAILFTTTASGAEPGTASDPIVTKSYVDQRLTEIIQLIQTQQASTSNSNNNNTTNPIITSPIAVNGDIDLDQLALLVDFLLKENLADAQLSTNMFVPVLAPAGTLLYPAQDGLEVILRSGNSSVVSGVNGITDLTTGDDLTNTQSIPINHYLVIPRTDRGILVETDSWFLLKGPYTITNAR